MVELNQSTVLILADMLENELRKFKIIKKVIACVKDSGVNQAVCTTYVKEVVGFTELGLTSSFDESCIAHIFSGACNAGIAQVTYSKLDLIYIKKANELLETCITWTKKSSRGPDECYKAYREMNKRE